MYEYQSVLNLLPDIYVDAKESEIRPAKDGLLNLQAAEMVR